MIGESPADQPAPTFALLLKRLRAEARMTQEELAHAAGLSPRSISDLERGISRTARKDTALLLADALAIGGSARTTFVAAARGRAKISEVLVARDATATEVPAEAVRWYPRIDHQQLAYEVGLRKLIDAMTAAAATDGSVITGIWLIGLTAQAASEPAPQRPLAQTIAVRDSVGGAVWCSASLTARVRSDLDAGRYGPGRRRHAQSRRGTR
jgi:transcriptional regulator with XRE-family HTH domain